MTAKKLLIHIGHNKTGTTAIQNALKASQIALQRQGVTYLFDDPVVGRDLLADSDFAATQNSHRLSASGMGVQDIEKISAQSWQDLCQKIKQSKTDHLLISSEYLFQPLTAASFSKLNHMLRDAADQTEVIAYVRDPSTYILSLLQQNLKQVREFPPISRTRIKDVVQPISQHLDGNISLNVFSRCSLLDGDIVADFLSKYLPMVERSSLEIPQSFANTSMSAEAIAVLLDLRSGRLDQALYSDQMIHQVRKADRRIPKPTKPKLRPDAAQSFVNWAAPDLTWLREEKDIVFPNVDYASINPEDIDKKILALERLENVCDVDNDRKMRIFERARFRMSLPRTVRRWLGKI